MCRLDSNQHLPLGSGYCLPRNHQSTGISSLKQMRYTAFSHLFKAVGSCHPHKGRRRCRLRHSVGRRAGHLFFSITNVKVLGFPRAIFMGVTSSTIFFGEDWGRTNISKWMGATFCAATSVEWHMTPISVFGVFPFLKLLPQI